MDLFERKHKEVKGVETGDVSAEEKCNNIRGKKQERQTEWTGWRQGMRTKDETEAKRNRTTVEGFWPFDTQYLSL